ncbi:MAG: hypothetical protein H7250_08940 [Flavobacterium sp.]|nr:hypothetical protein [Flavobacterium sp.]
MRKLNILILLFLALKSYSQEIEEIRPFYLQEISAFKAYYENSTEYNSEKLNRIFKEINSLPKVNSVNSKFYKENNNLIFEIYEEKNISLKLITSNNKKLSTIYLYSKGKVEHEIPYLENKIDGVYKVFLNDGKLLFETNYKSGKRNGYRKFYTLSENRIIEGNFINGQITGKIKVIEPENNRYLLYPNNLKNGIIEYYDISSNLYCEVPFIEGNIIQGEVIDYYYQSKNKRLVRNHKMGKLDGKTEYFDEKGNSKCILNYKDGMPIGEHKEFYLTGRIYKEIFYDENGIKIGTWKTYDESGKLSGELHYVNGKINGIEKIYINGILRSTREYVDDNLNGSWKHWNSETKIIESESQMIDNKCVSIIFYFKNGKISKRFENNAKNQPIRAEYFDKNGNLFYEEKYNSDKSSEGTHKYYFYDKNEDYFLGNEDEFDKNGFKIREKNYLKNDDYEEIRYKNNGCKIKIINRNKLTTTEYYYFGKKIEIEEFKKLDK